MRETALNQPPSGTIETADRPRRPRGKQLGALLIIVLAAGFVWSFTQYQKTQAELERLLSEQAQQQLAAAQTDQLLEKVRRHLLLPEDEEPTVATVSDAEALRQSQPFFAQAQNGDRVLIYVNNRRSILYSPERDVIVNVGALVVNDATQSDSSAEVAGEQTTAPQPQ